MYLGLLINKLFRVITSLYLVVDRLTHTLGIQLSNKINNYRKFYRMIT